MLKRPFSIEEENFIRREFPHRKTRDVAIELGRSEKSVHLKAGYLGVKKTPEYLASPAACRLKRGDKVGWAHRFPKGHVPFNKGTKRPGYAVGRMADTQFKKGRNPHNWKPIGSIRLSKDGYLQRKISETRYPPRDWVGEHVLLWRDSYGPIPKGHAVVFKDGDKTHIALKNLELISRAELMQRNTIHARYPEDVKRAIQMAGALRRRIREKSGKPTKRGNVDEQEDGGCARLSV